MIVSKAELAKILGKDEKTIFRWLKEGIPIIEHGSRGKESKFDTEAVIEWLIARATNGKEIEAARLRLTLAQARNAELDADEKEGRLIPLESMGALWSNVLTSFRARILSIPSRLTPQISATNEPAIIDKLIKTALHEALNELAEYDPTSNNKKPSKGRGRSIKDGGRAAAS